jgi:hypothetical protein
MPAYGVKPVPRPRPARPAREPPTANAAADPDAPSPPSPAPVPAFVPNGDARLVGVRKGLPSRNENMLLDPAAPAAPEPAAPTPAPAPTSPSEGKRRLGVTGARGGNMLVLLLPAFSAEPVPTPAAALALVLYDVAVESGFLLPDDELTGLRLDLLGVRSRSEISIALGPPVGLSPNIDLKPIPIKSAFISELKPEPNPDPDAPEAPEAPTPSAGGSRCVLKCARLAFGDICRPICESGVRCGERPRLSMSENPKLEVEPRGGGVDGPMDMPLRRLFELLYGGGVLRRGREGNNGKIDDVFAEEVEVEVPPKLIICELETFLVLLAAGLGDPPTMAIVRPFPVVFES